MHMQMFWGEKFQKIYWKHLMFAIHIIVQQEVRACIKIQSVQPQWNATQSDASDTQNHNSDGESG